MITYYETHLRSMLKALSWRICGTLAIAILVFIFTKRIDIAAIVGGFDFMLKIIFYFLHERIWNKIKFGRKEITPFVLWFTGVPYSGKTTIADEIYSVLKKNGLKVERLDSKDVRSLFPELGFKREEVNSHIKRIGHLANTLEKNGIIVIASFVSPYSESREFVENLCSNFIEIYTRTSLEVSRERYHNSSQAKSKDFPEEIFRLYEEPSSSQIVLDTEKKNVRECVKVVLDYINKYHL